MRELFCNFVIERRGLCLVLIMLVFDIATDFGSLLFNGSLKLRVLFHKILSSIWVGCELISQDVTNHFELLISRVEVIVFVLSSSTVWRRYPFDVFEVNYFFLP